MFSLNARERTKKRSRRKIAAKLGINLTFNSIGKGSSPNQIWPKYQNRMQNYCIGKIFDNTQNFYILIATSDPVSMDHGPDSGQPGNSALDISYLKLVTSSFRSSSKTWIYVPFILWFFAGKSIMLSQQ